MEHRDYLKLHQELQDYVALLQTAMEEVRYGNPYNPHNPRHAILVVRYVYFNGCLNDWKYTVRSVSRSSGKGEVLFDPTEEGTKALMDHVMAIIKDHHRPLRHSILNIVDDTSVLYAIPRPVRLDENGERANHMNRVRSANTDA